jgi:hypothetical protein
VRKQKTGVRITLVTPRHARATIVAVEKQ